MGLLHATWLRHCKECDGPGLFLWADTWKVAVPETSDSQSLIHPFTLSSPELTSWLKKKEICPEKSTKTTRFLTLPSKQLTKTTKKNSDSEKYVGKSRREFLPLQAGENISQSFQLSEWEVEGMILTPFEATKWLSQLPLRNKHSYIGEEVLWWAHFQRWTLKLIANGSWLPQAEQNAEEESTTRARWIPLLNQENERNRLEEFIKTMPLVINCAVPLLKKSKEFEFSQTTRTEPELRDDPMESWCRSNKRVEVVHILEEIIDVQLRNDFQPNSTELDPLLSNWEKALGSKSRIIDISNEDAQRLIQASKNWKRGLSANLRSGKVCFKLIAPINDNEEWALEFFLQAEADPKERIPAAEVWKSGSNILNLNHIQIEQPVEILLEGLGRALTIFPTIERGLEKPKPTSMKLSAQEAFVFIKTASIKLRDIGIGVILPKSLSHGLANRLGITIKAELRENSKGIQLGESLDWSWSLMIGGKSLTIKELEKLAEKNNPLLNHKGTWIELRPNDLKNAKKFYTNPPQLNLFEAFSLSKIEGNTLLKLPVHQFKAGPRLQHVLKQYHHQTEPEPIKAPNGFHGKLRHYQERGLGWLYFLHRFNQGACLADDMGLGKTIELLAFIQHLKVQNELTKPILLVTPTSVLTNWQREASIFTPELSILEHYGPTRATKNTILEKSLKKIDIVITSYGLAQKDVKLLKNIKWQGVVIDEAQTIKNPKTKQSLAIREISENLTSNQLRIALTGTPIENRISEIWALMNFLNPTVLGKEDFFNQRYKLPIENYGDISSLKDLKSRVSPFILRRLKTDQSIISDLPQKIEKEEWINLTQEQEFLYKKTVEKSLNEISSTPINQKHGKTLGLLVRLKQICNHPALALKEKHIDEHFLERSKKLQRLQEILDEILESNEKAILFTQFAEWGHLLQTYFEKQWDTKIPFLYGGTSKNNRQEMIDRFQQDPRGPNIFLLSLKAGGLGLNLTRAKHVVHIDRWWNPAIENQATDRAYRIGQTQSVIVHKFITTGSIEERIHQMISNKTMLSENIIESGEQWLQTLSVEALRKLVTLDTNVEEF